jgi:hypothetical protein
MSRKGASRIISNRFGGEGGRKFAYKLTLKPFKDGFAYSVRVKMQIYPCNSPWMLIGL